MKTKLFIADDHKIVIDAIQTQIQLQSNDFEVVGYALNGSDTLAKMKELEVDILILDISMPEIDGVEVLKRVSDEFPEVKVLVLTMMDDYKHIREMYSLGAKGYILKNKGTQYVVKALSEIRDGEVFIPEDVSRITTEIFIPNDDNKLKSDRDKIIKSIRDHEAELLGLLTLELSAKEIADRMCKSQSTIETWKKNLMKKVDVKSAMGLVRFAMENGFKKDE
jgi:DNA-binding NarL/FixJ family response regulator